MTTTPQPTTGPPARRAAFHPSPAVKNALHALFVAVAGFALLNAAFAFVGFLAFLLGFVLPRGDLRVAWLAIGAYLAVLALLSWLVARSRMRTLYKATFLTVPTASVLAILGALLYPWPWAAWGAGALVSGGLVAYVLATRRPWLYAYAVALVALVMAGMMLLGVEV